MEILFMLGFFVLIFAGFYLLFIRPQQNRQKQQNQFIGQLKMGDEVITVGGLYGKIVAMDDKSTVVETENGAELRFMREAIAAYANVPEENESQSEVTPS